MRKRTGILLLDEPTTFLDIAHQIETLDLLADLNAQGRTIVAVPHDLNHACRCASHLIAMKDENILAEGAPPPSSRNNWLKTYSVYPPSSSTILYRTRLLSFQERSLVH